MSAKAISRHAVFAAALFVLLGGSTSAMADPPGRVGRLSFMEGTVSFHAADQDQWSPATLNFPVTSGNSFWTEPNSRVELQVGDAELRLDQSTELDIARLDDGGTQFEVEQGVINIHLHSLPPGGMTVTTSRGNVALLQPGSYHIDAGHPNGDAPADEVQVTVLEGKAELDGPNSSLQVLAGETASESGNPTNFRLTEGNATPFDDWALSREHREVASKTVNFVSPQTTGYQDLDHYGDWQTTGDYGAVWYPTAVAVDWAPYRYGHWAFIPPWGWTWVDDAPWGFAPFHYGRWVFVDHRWGWCPGTFIERPVYAPALVAFIGGPGFGISISIGNAFPAVGWVPLAPFEVFHPYYHASPEYVRNVNITNVNKTVIDNITVVNNTTVNNFANQQAATVVSSAAFRGAAPVGRARLTVAREELASAKVAANVDHLQPTAVARAGIAVPGAAETAAPKPGVEAKIAKGTVFGNAGVQTEHAGVGANAPENLTVPKAPGPQLHGNFGGNIGRSTAAHGNEPAGSPAEHQVLHEQPAARGANAPMGAASPAITNAPANGSGPARVESHTNVGSQPKPGGAPGPAIVHHGENANIATPQNAAPNGTSPNVLPSGSDHGAPAALSGESQTKPLPGAAPGPPIIHHGESAHFGTPQGNQNAAPQGNAPGGSVPGRNAPGGNGPEGNASPRNVPSGNMPSSNAPAHETAPVHENAPVHVETTTPPMTHVNVPSTPQIHERGNAPTANIPHPVQQTQIKPTPQGWTREARPGAANAPNAAPGTQGNVNHGGTPENRGEKGDPHKKPGE